MEYDWKITAARLKKLRNEYKGKGISHDALSKALEEKYGEKISASSLKNYEVSDPYHTKAKKVEGMSIRNLYCLADFFGVSTDYLLGKTEHETPNEEIREICDYTGLSVDSLKRLVNLKEAREYSHRENGFTPISVIDELLKSYDFLQLILAIHHATLTAYESIEANKPLDAIESFEEAQEYIRKQNKVLRELQSIVNQSGFTDISIGSLSTDALDRKYGAIYRAGHCTELVIKRLLLRFWGQGNPKDREEIDADCYRLERVYGEHEAAPAHQ